MSTVNKAQFKTFKTDRAIDDKNKNEILTRKCIAISSTLEVLNVYGLYAWGSIPDSLSD